nr:FAD-dependent oxidoreductase [Clostridia bacterium]
CYWAKDDEFYPDLKAHALLGLCLEAGAQVEFSAIVCGVKKEADSVSGVYWAQGGKLHYSASRTVIDCTGDGDVCMFAGAEHIYGNEADGMTFWASLAQYDSAGSYQNNFSTMVHVGDPLDYTRFILAGRLRGENMYDHGTYVAVRESRHIRGLETVTLEDILSMRERKDTLYTCFSNYDPKGRLTSELVYFGLLPPHQRIDIPRGAVIPVDKGGRTIGGLLVGGKAVSCTHDAFPGIRMQPDLQRQGLALAALAYQGLKQDVPFIQAEHVEETILRLDGDLMRADRPDSADLAAVIASLDGSESWEWLDEPIRHWQSQPSPITRILLADCDEVLPPLRQAYLHTEKPELRLALARLLLWHGDETGVDCIVRALQSEFELAAGLPRRRASVRFGELLPDHGLMPEAVYLMNGLARAKSVSLVTIFEPILECLEDSDRDWQDLRSGIYCYCESFALTAVRSGDQAFIPLLHRVLNLPELKRKATMEILEERFCMLKITLYSAMNTLGDPCGRAGLEGFLKDERRPLVLAAKMLTERSSICHGLHERRKKHC